MSLYPVGIRQLKPRNPRSLGGIYQELSSLADVLPAEDREAARGMILECGSVVAVRWGPKRETEMASCGKLNESSRPHDCQV